MNPVHEWKLNEHELQTVYDGNIGAYIPCPITISTPIISNNSSTPGNDISWNLSLYPTGNDHHTAQYSYISIHTRSIPNNVLNIFINYNIQIKEINSIIWSENNVNINPKHLLHILKPNNASVILQSSQLKNCKTITFKIYITIQDIASKYKKQRADPPISNQINNTKIINSRYGTHGRFSDPLHAQNNNNYEFKQNENDMKLELELDDNILEYECYPSNIILLDFEFKLCCFPNGNSKETKGFVIMCLDVKQLSYNISNLCVHWNFYCLQTQTYSTSIKDLNNKLSLNHLHNITGEVHHNLNHQNLIVHFISMHLIHQIIH
eukprot:481634_1